MNREKKRNLFMAFIDIVKTYDRVIGKGNRISWIKTGIFVNDFGGSIWEVYGAMMIGDNLVCVRWIGLST